jgi:acetate kinase
MDISAYLSSVNLFSDLTPAEIAMLANGAALATFDDGQTIIKMGETGRFLWVVAEGKVKVKIPDSATGESAEIAEIGPGGVFGEMSIMTGEPAMADVIAAAHSALIKIQRGLFSLAIIKNPETLGKIAKIITLRLVQRERNETEKARLKTLAMENKDPYDLNFSSVHESIKILVINCGSSSLKYSLFDTANSSPLIEGLVEKVGTPKAFHKFKTAAESGQSGVMADTIQDAFCRMTETLTNPAKALIKDLSQIKAVGHRVVHGGMKFASSVVINDEVIAAIKECATLAPLHNPYNLAGIEQMKKLMPDATQVAVFDTAFHQSMPESAFLYALPRNLYTEKNIRRYGFHGTNHNFVALKAAMYFKRPVGELKLISCHLGNGTSVCAIDHGRSVDTSMGLTPLEGIVMGTRGGDIDPGVIVHLLRGGMNVDELDKMLNKQSGLLGLSGVSNDMREVLEAADKGNSNARGAISVFCYRIKKYIGSYIAALEGLDALIFTGGIGENSAEIRARVCRGLEQFGISLLDELNVKTRSDRDNVKEVSEAASRVKILVIAADEERMIARESIHATRRFRVNENVEHFKTKPIPLSVSAHHVHLSKQDFESVFGVGKTLTPKAPLSQPGQFAAEQTVNLVGPKGAIPKVRILGPLRKESQVEISRTEEFKLGIDAPIRNSGDIEGTPGITLDVEGNKYKIAKGVICARRHIHMSPEDALGFGVRDGDTVMVRVASKRELIYGDVVVRVHPDYRLDMHLDTDEANAAEIDTGTVGYIAGIQSRAVT